jgi:cobalamin biosynthesis Mg chelatase CobN
MDGMRRHEALGPGSSVLASVLALLALACLPVLARADSATDQYTEESHTATGKSHRGAPLGDRESPAQASTAGSEPVAPAQPEAVTGAESSTGHPSSGSTAGSGSNTKRSNGQRKPDRGLPPASRTDTPVSSSGGSSPLVPILISVVLLAAISIGAVIMRARQRRVGGDAAIS